MLEISELVTLTSTLAYGQMGHAVDTLLISREFASSLEAKHSWILSHRYAVSSIVHSYIGFESFVNYIGSQLFIDTESPKFIPKQDRSLPLRRLIAAWERTVSIAEKFDYLVSMKEVTVDAILVNELREVNRLRNMIVHGACFETTLLLESKPTTEEPNVHLLVDREDSIDWKESFPNTKFKSLDRLDYEDASTVLRIIIQALRTLCKAHIEGMVIVSYHKGIQTSQILPFHEDNMSQVLQLE